jgi:hypothetical protein
MISINAPNDSPNAIIKNQHRRFATVKGYVNAANATK